MAKRKKSSSPKKNDSKAAVVMISLLVIGIVLFLFISKSKEVKEVQKPQEHKITTTSEPEDRYIPSENVKPVEEVPQEAVAPQPIVAEPESEPEVNISGSGGKIAFIIDDWGQSMANCKYLRDIPEPMAVSILPGLRHTKDVANCAREYHKVAMLHLPLEAFHNYDIYPPNYIIKTSMPPDLVTKIVEEDLDQLPTIEGVNNHMGSKATTSKYLMKLVFKRIKRRGLFFVDSMTARGTVCAALAQEMGVTFGKRDVFLDNVNTRPAITKQIMELAQKARHRGYAVAIGHDRHLTMQVIKDEIPYLEKQGFEIVSIKELLKNR